MPDVAGPDSDESDSLPEDLYGDSDDALSPMAKNSNDGGSSDEGSLGSGFEEEDDDIVGSGDDAPDGLLRLSSDEAQEEEEEEEEWGGIGGNVVATDKKRKAKDQPGGRNGGYVVYLPLLPSNDTRSSLTRLMKRIYSHPLNWPILCNTNIYEKSLECNSLSVK